MRGLSLVVVSGGYSLGLVHGLFTLVASPHVEHGVSGAGASVVVVHVTPEL